MPVKKNKTRKNENTALKTKKQSIFDALIHTDPPKGLFGEGARKILVTLFGILLAYAIVWFGTVINNNLEKAKYIGFADKLERRIVIEGQGRVSARPDTAVTEIGMIAEGETVEEAQRKNTQVMNTLIEKLKIVGVGPDDIQTKSYNIYPRYNYTQDDGRELKGYEVDQSVQVKIQDLSKASDVLALVGAVGANTVSGLDFILDDTDVYTDQARQKALIAVAKKADLLANSLGVELLSVVSYSEYEGGNSLRTLGMLDGYGYSETVEPVFEAGSTDVVVQVSVTFEIR